MDLNHKLRFRNDIYIHYKMQSNLDEQLERLKNGELLKEKDIKSLCAKVREIFIEEGNVQRIDSPVTVVGDVHG